MYMNWLFPAIVATLISIFILAVVYFYLYTIDRQKYLLIWCVGWGFYALRLIFMLLLILPLGLDPYLLVANQLAALMSGVFLLGGTYRFLERKIPYFWVYWAIFSGIWVLYSTFSQLDFRYMTLPNYTFLGAVSLWTGVVLLRYLERGGLGTQITGGSFILWGLHKFNYPFLRPVEWFAPWGYLIGATLALIVAIGMILVYFRKTREDLQRSESRYRSVIESLSEGIVVHDLSGRVIACNQSALDILQFTKTELMNWSPTASHRKIFRDDGSPFPPEEHPVLLTLRTKKPYHQMIMGIQRDDERLIWISVNTQPIYDTPPSELRGVVASLTDITRRRAAEMELRQHQEQLEELVKRRTQELELAKDRAEAANLAKNEFLEIVAHDLKNPLTAIGINADLLRVILKSRWTEDVADLELYLQIITDKVEQMNIAIKNLLELDRLESGYLQLQKERLNAETILHRLVMEYRELSQRKNIEIEYEKPEMECSILGDQYAVREIFDNLLSNAIKYSPPNKKIYVRTSIINGSYVQVEIQDEGQGLTPEDQQKLFSKFAKLSARPTGGEISTGLGLSIVKKLVEAHNGKVWAESEGRHKGTTFVVRLPQLTR